MIGVAFIPMRYTVQRLRDDLIEQDAHGDDVKRPLPPVDVAAAGWFEPTAEAKNTYRDFDHVSYDLDLQADAGKIVVGEMVIVGGEKFRVIGKSNYDNGPFGFQPGLDFLRLHRTEG